MEYEKRTLSGSGKNEPNTNPNEPNLLNAQMNVNNVLTKDYENKSTWALYENEPKTNPICRGVASGEAGSNPIPPPHAAKQTQYKPNLSRRSLWRSRIKPNPPTPHFYPLAKPRQPTPPDQHGMSTGNTVELADNGLLGCIVVVGAPSQKS